MMKYANIRNVAPLCGVMLGLLILCSIASPEIVRASGDAGGWILVPVGSNCRTTAWLPCSGGEDPGVIGCDGGWFSGVEIGTGGTVKSNGYSAGCITGQDPDTSWYCASVLSTRCE
jgi:hypothetical protein